MSAKTQRWKGAEKQLQNLYLKYGINAKRKLRGSNFAISDYDVEVFDMPELKSDSKYSIKGFKTSRLLETIREKYCKEKNDIPLLFCKGYQEISGKITVDADFFIMILSFWLGKNTKEKLLEIFNG